MAADPKMAGIVGSGFIGRAWAIARPRRLLGAFVLSRVRRVRRPSPSRDSVLDDLAANDLLVGRRRPKSDAHFDGDRSGQALPGAMRGRTPRKTWKQSAAFPS
jgi:hypothetical protein